MSYSSIVAQKQLDYGFLLLTHMVCADGQIHSEESKYLRELSDYVSGSFNSDKITLIKIIVKSIILNAMGFFSRPLYLFPQFFKDKATEHLFGSGIFPEYFNDDKIGRVMDKLYKIGLNKIFLAIALTACKRIGRRA